MGQNIDYSRIQKHDVQKALDDIESYWKTLKRKTTPDKSTLIALPNPYVVPSNGTKEFKFEEQYYWDSFFVSLGIHDEKLVCGMLDNLLFMFNEFELVPNANRYYFTSRSQPPLLTTFIFHAYEKYGKNKQWLKKRINIAKREYQKVWMNEDHPKSHLVYKDLSRYYDVNHLHDLAEAESGWDMTPRFKRQCLDYLPIDLNCLLYKYEADFARAAHILGDKSEERVWHHAAELRKAAITKLMWNNRKAFFFDYNYQTKKQSDVYSLAAYYAMWAGLASDHQVQKLVMQLRKFDNHGGLTTTAGTIMYAPLFGSTDTQWAYPNGWAPLHYFVTEGLMRYGHKHEAEKIAKKWLATGLNWYEANGVFLEKYNVVNTNLPPVSGLYPSQTGFGWTNGVFAYFAEKYL